jgi:hypothetical protein
MISIKIKYRRASLSSIKSKAFDPSVAEQKAGQLAPTM